MERMGDEKLTKGADAQKVKMEARKTEDAMAGMREDRRGKNGRRMENNR